MSQQFDIDHLIPLGKARRELIPRGNSGNSISPATAWRWTTKGLISATGERVKLAVVMVGGRPFVTREDVEKFFSRLTEARENAAEREHLDDDEALAAKDRRLKQAGLL